MAADDFRILVYLGKDVADEEGPGLGYSWSIEQYKENRWINRRTGWKLTLEDAWERALAVAREEGLV